MRAWVIVLIAAAGCGRLGFEPAERAAPCGPADPLGAWSFDDDALDGATVRDVSGQGHDGALVGSPPPVSVPGQRGEALDYAATSVGYVDLPGLPVDSSPGARTSVALWFFTAAASVDEVLIYLPPGEGEAAPRYDLWLTTGEGPRTLCINTGFGDCWGIVDETLRDRWVHVVAVFANGPTVDGTLFVDGAPVTMSCVFGVCDQARVASLPVTLGGSDTKYAWHGKLDEVAIYDRALTAEEAASLAACR